MGFTFFCFPILFLLIGLGVWQLERLQWKLELIAEISRNMAAAPITFDAALALGDHAQYRPVEVTGRFENSKEVYVYTTGPNGVPVYHLLTPFLLADGRIMLVDRGFVPTALRDPASRSGSEVNGTISVVGIWRMPDKPGLFTPSPDYKHHIWFARDVSRIAQTVHLKLATPAILEMKTSPAGAPWPRAGQTRVDIPNDHLQYALTWFLLAGAFVVIYFAYHRAQGRLKFGANSGC